jgi:hypothetical protein
MSLPELLSDAVVVVLRGQFATASLTPAWLFDKGLIGKREIETSRYELLIPDEIAVFKADWLSCRVERTRMEFSTDVQAEFERLRDVVVGVVRDLPDLEAASLGINRNVHFGVASGAAWHAVGDAIVPKEQWSDVLNLPGMRSVTLWAIRPDLYEGRVQVQVEPSQPHPPAIYVAVNDHFDLFRVEKQPTSRDDLPLAPGPIEPDSDKKPAAIEILNTEWSESMRRAEEIITHVAQLGASPK